MGWDPPLAKDRPTVLPQSLQLYWWETADLTAAARAARDLCQTPQELERTRLEFQRRAAELHKRLIDHPEDQPLPKRRIVLVE